MAAEGSNAKGKSAISTGRGDDGTTGLLFSSERILKDDPRTEAFGTVDEAIAALGLARAELATAESFGNLPRTLVGWGGLILRLQRELFVVGAELATAPDAVDRQTPGKTRVTASMVSGLSDLLADTEGNLELPREFVVPGETRLSAALELARTIVRRAERRAIPVRQTEPGQPGAREPLTDDQLIAYLNRLSDLLWILSRLAEKAESRTAVPSRTDRP